MTLISSTAGKVVFGLLLVVAVLIGGYSALLSLAQNRVVEATLAYLSSYDAENFSYRRISFQSGEVILYGLSFDEHGFNTIDRVTISYAPFEFLRDKTIQTATLLHPVVTLESSEIMEGSGISYSDIPVEFLQIEKGEVNFLTQIFGGIIVNYSANVKKQSDGVLLTAQYSSGQPHMKFSGSLQGAILATRTSEIQIALDGVEINTTDIHIRRSNGDIRLTLNPDNYLESAVQFQAIAGAARLYGYPWVNSTFSVEGTRHDFRFFSAGKTTDKAQAEFTYSFEKNNEGIVQSSGSVFSAHGDAFYRYIIRNNPDLLHPDDQPQLMGMDTVDLNFEIYPLKRLLVYYLPEERGKGVRRREILFSQ